MSAFPTAPAPMARRPALLRAELLRTRRTFTWGASLVSLASTLFCVRLAAAATHNGLAAAQGRWDGNVLGWLSLYAFAVLLPLGALMGALAGWREARWREGGTAWRDLSAARVLLTRVVVLALACAACQGAVLVPVLIQSHLVGEGWGPVGTWCALGALWALAQCAAAAWGLLGARFLGSAAVALAPALAVAWAVAGAVQSEASSWLARPWTWSIRAMLPLLGTHGNSVNLEPADAAWGYALWPSFALTLLLGLVPVLLLVLAARAGRSGIGRRRSTRRESAGGRRSVGEGRTMRAEVPTHRPVSAAPAVLACQSAVPAWSVPVVGPRRRPTVTHALAATLPWAVWAGLTALLLALLLAVRALYSPGRALDVLALVALPVAACVVGTMAWRSVAEPWRLILTRCAAGRLVVALTWVPSTALGVALIVVGLLAGHGAPLLPSAADGGGVAPTVYALVTVPFVAAMLVAVSAAAAQWCGTGASIAVGIIGLLDSLVIAGNEMLSASLWPWAPWGWSYVAGQYPQTWVRIVLQSIGITVLALAAIRAGARRSARLGTE